jgi:Flp pilus assembly protein TadD
MRRVASFLAILLATAAYSAQPTWIVMQNENFRVYSTAGERRTRTALNQLERVRGFFAQLLGASPAKAVPVCVVIFGSGKEYQPYRLNEFATAYYSNSSYRDVIVIGELGEASSLITAHEYTHLVFEHGGYSLPPWLNEGFAEFFSTLRPAGDDTDIGEILPSRLQEMGYEAWVPLEIILAVDQHSPYYNEKQRAGSFYNESWALVHMLATSDTYRPRFGEVVTSINNGTPSAQVLEKAYGMPLAKLEEELRSYIRGDRFRKLRARIRIDGTDNLKSQPADLFEVREAEAELLMGLEGREPEARTRFEALAREDAGRPEPWANLGYLAWREGRQGEAVEDFGKAFELGGRSPRLLLDFGELAQQEKPEASAAALAALLELQPGSLDARLLLASLQVRLGQFSEALATSRPIRAVMTVDQRDHLLYLRAYASMRLGNAVEARTEAQELKRVSSDQDMQRRADEILHASAQR